MSSDTVRPRILEVRGSSGAVFTIPFSDDRLIVKEGGDRVAEQGAFMSGLGHLGVFPHVTNVTEESYVMDRLTEVPYHLMEPLAFVEEAVATLGNVWAEEPSIAFDRTAHLMKVEHLCQSQRVNLSMFMKVFEEFDINSVVKTMTHGDATLENIMLGMDGSLKLIDPIPATPAVPHLRCVDVGKMLQSAYGFEQIRYGDALFPGIEAYEVEDVIFSQLDMGFNEILASQYWTMVHFLRAMPYMKTIEERKKIRNVIERIYMVLGI